MDGEVSEWIRFWKSGFAEREEREGCECERK